MKLGFIGTGNMAGAIMGGIIKKGIIPAEEIIGSDIMEMGRNHVKELYGIRVTADNKEVAEKAEVLVLSVKPQFYDAVIKEIKELITETQIIVTIAPGKTLEYLAGARAVFVTNAVSHAQTLAKMGIRVYLIGGELKSSTEAVVGSQAMQMIQMYHFTKGFFGTNGITKREGFTTPDTNEAIVKSTAMKQCKDVYVLADTTKFGQVSSVTFGEFADGCILTEEIPEEYRESRNILKV